MKHITTLLLVLGILMVPEATASSQTIPEMLDIPQEIVHLTTELPSGKPGRIAETNGEEIWIHPDRLQDMCDTLAHEVSHINAWTPSDWHGEVWEEEYARTRAKCSRVRAASGGVLAPSQSVHASSCAPPQAAPLAGPYSALRFPVNPSFVGVSLATLGDGQCSAL